MQAIRVSSFLPSLSFSSLVPISVPIPQQSPGELLVRITHVSPQQVDVLYLQGKHQNNNAKHGHVLPPFLLGLDFAGVVVSLSSDRQSGLAPVFQVGDRVMGSKLGAFAQFICVRPGDISKVPSGLSNAGAAALVGAAVSYGAVIQIAKVRKGETVLVTGVPGGLGVAACQIAKAIGAKVVAMASSMERAASLETMLGADLVLGADDEEWVRKIKNFTDGHGVHAVIDNVGLVEKSLQSLAYGGRIIIVGFAGRNGAMEKIGMNRILLKSASVLGYRFGEEGRRNPRVAVQARQGYNAMLVAGTVKPLLDSKSYHGLGSIAQALQDLRDSNLVGKAVISIEGSTKARL